MLQVDKEWTAAEVHHRAVAFDCPTVDHSCRSARIGPELSALADSPCMATARDGVDYGVISVCRMIRPTVGFDANIRVMEKGVRQ